MRFSVKPLIAGVFFCLVTWVSVTPSPAAVSCKVWNTSTFFRIADTDDVSRCLKDGANVNARDKHGETPLHHAAAHTKMPTVVTALIQAGAKINARSESGITPLHRAAAHTKMPTVVTALVQAGAKINARSEMRLTPLHYAVRNNKSTTVLMALLKAEADVNVRDVRGFTPLHRAAGGGGGREVAILDAQSKAIKAFVAALQDRHSPTEANRKGKLAKKGVDYKKIFQEVSGGNPAFVTALLDAGANPNARDYQRRIALHWAAEYGIPAIVAALLKAGADPTAKDEKGKTAWDLAKKNPSLKGTDVYWQLNEVRFKIPIPPSKRKKWGSGNVSTF